MSATAQWPLSDASLGWAGSLLLHGIVLLLMWSAWSFWRPETLPPVVLAIEATVVMAQPRRVVEPPAPQPVSPRESTPAVSQPAPPREQPRAATTVVRQADQPAKPPPVTREDPQVARERAARERQAAESARLAAEAREREAALRASLIAEERAQALRGSAAAASWHDSLRAHIERQWRRPPSARAGLRCVVLVDQIPGGEVIRARISDCNGDDAVRQSIEAAVLRASPLPQPPDPALFERRLELIFAPGD